MDGTKGPGEEYHTTSHKSGLSTEYTVVIYFRISNGEHRNPTNKFH